MVNYINSEEAKSEAFRIGTIISNINDKSSVIIPLDILEYISQKSSVNINELIISYTKGLIKNNKDLEKEIFK